MKGCPCVYIAVTVPRPYLLTHLSYTSSNVDAQLREIGRECAVLLAEAIAMLSSVLWDDLPAFLATLRASLAAFFASLSAMHSSKVGIEGLSSIELPKGAMICFTT